MLACACLQFYYTSGFSSEDYDAFAEAVVAVAIDFPSFMELRFIDMKEKWLLTSSLLARERNERLSKTSKAELDGAISILASLPRRRAQQRSSKK